MNDLARHFSPEFLRQLKQFVPEVASSVPKTNERPPAQTANENVPTVPSTAIKARKAHIWKQEDNGHYVEPRWVSRSLFAIETFQGDIFDPCCGFGNIVTSATEAGLVAIGADLVDRGFDKLDHTGDFLEAPFVADNVVMNPPFHDGNPQRFVEHALKHTRRKVACVFTQARLNAAHWLKHLPLRRVWLLTPRPSMPPGWKYREYQADGKEASGDTKEYCWLVFEQGYVGEPSLGWIHRDGKSRRCSKSGAGTLVACHNHT